MPGRQAHGRPLMPKSGGGGRPKHRVNNKTADRKSRNNVLDAFAIAAEQVPQKKAKGVRTRDLDEPEERPQKRQRDGDDEDDEDGDEDEEDLEDARPQKKKAKNSDDFEGFSDGGEDSDGEEWHVGVGADDEDSELDSDEAFGESDEEKFDGYAFSGSSSNKKGKKAKKGGNDSDEEEEDEDEDDDLESLGSDAIDLATALDQYESSEEEEGEEESGSEDDADSESSESEDSDDDMEDPSKLDDLQKMISGFAGDDNDDEEQSGSKPTNKLSLSDLGLLGVQDPHMKKSLKLMNKEEKAAKPGQSKKLDIPLAKRQQDKLLRSAAYEKTSETLERWIDTVKHNRRADHLVFPLAQNAHDAGLDSQELLPVTKATAGTELEQTILAIMEESGLGPTNKPKKEDQDNVEEIAARKGLSAAEMQEITRQKRRERELFSREQARQKRIKKIKSKAYRRIHRKELLHDEQEMHDAMVEAGEIDSEEEREALDRRRALERVGTRHRDSKWAKLGKKAGRAVWDDNFRAGLTEAARQKEELRRRIEGRRKGEEDSEDSGSDDYSAESGDEKKNKKRLLEQLEHAASYADGEVESGLMQMKFMQRGEAQKRKENDEMIAQIRRDLDSDYDSDDVEETDIGRRQFGMGKTEIILPGQQAAQKKKEKKNITNDMSNLQVTPQQAATTQVEDTSLAASVAGAWSKAPQEGRKSTKKAAKVSVGELDLSNAAMLASKPKPKSKDAAAAKDKKSSAPATTTHDDSSSDDEETIHLPLAIRDQELIKRAFAGEDVVGDFNREKAEVEKEDDDKEIDNTLPGWGGWVGEGISNREKKRHTGRFVTKVEGVKKEKRKDFKLKGVIIKEGRVKKNDQYLATSLPHPFESQAQYERSLRIPVGPEWTTKETFQDATKPRVILKQGIIAPMSKPVL
ncbi:Utp14-domain-containing protein [Neurospora crassa]|uniref:Small nucleolar ribonucleoprotein complex subunit Utp14 n=1 Tax=Neurospora crassa (strain ATCC 24698 / 74-OR23-1A / CBS 708.71 / DSM 1257 / FGSC 987) TaxID=367110 RepID=Q7S5V9_NEUCR|nr:small nucleolar ribonucleoprotein complex subunit Utp14 [Neurospora crassa OR74A]EAA30911.1 small nucleolar ribonucleoprotein complex subunit Utp14 [Neurospora crassa OR74A]KHE86873.1 Utp14-domain-containing protein [Neurospora crassa]|eukprot:XP_960147.1 small nucleolar ribonucleoprotein complex subunit Utp14 [Neurospora crassa OR74A]